MGLTAPPPKLSELDLAHKRFLIEGERAFRSLVTFHQSRSPRPAPPTGLAKYVVFSPLKDAELEPDLVIFLCNPTQGCRLTTLAAYPDGALFKPCITGSACYQSITYPIVTGEVNVSLMDYSSRKKWNYRDDQIFVSIPYPRIAGLVESIDHCSVAMVEEIIATPQILLKEKEGR